MASTDIETVIDQVERTSSDSTGSRYAGSIRIYAKWCSSEDRNPFAATSLDVEDYLRDLHEDRDYSYSTVNVHLAALTKFFDAADDLVSKGREVPSPREESPVSRWENPTEDARLNNVVTEKKYRKNTKKGRALSKLGEVHGLNKEQIASLMDATPSPRLRNEVLLKIAYQAMLRRGEVARLKIDDITFEKQSITIRPEVSKNGEKRTTYYQPSLNSSLKSWLNIDREAYATAPESDYVFLSNERGRLSDFHVGHIFRQASLEAGLQSLDEPLYTDARGHDKLKYSFHSLRHAGAVRRWENDCDLRTLQKLLGHESIKTTETYLDVTDEALGEKARATW